jgi:hypothetical protein
MMKYFRFIALIVVCFLFGAWFGGAFTALETLAACKPNTTLTYDSAILKKPATIRCEIVSAGSEG